LAGLLCDQRRRGSVLLRRCDGLASPLAGLPSASSAAAATATTRFLLSFGRHSDVTSPSVRRGFAQDEAEDWRRRVRRLMLEEARPMGAARWEECHRLMRPSRVESTAL
jgi:hypothetical protein